MKRVKGFISSLQSIIQQDNDIESLLTPNTITIQIFNLVGEIVILHMTSSTVRPLNEIYSSEHVFVIFDMSIMVEQQAVASNESCTDMTDAALAKDL